MKLTKSELNELINNGILLRDELIANDLKKKLPLIKCLEREQKLARLINIAEYLASNGKIEVE